MSLLSFMSPASHATLVGEELVTVICLLQNSVSALQGDGVFNSQVEAMAHKRQSALLERLQRAV